MVCEAVVDKNSAAVHHAPLAVDSDPVPLATDSDPVPLAADSDPEPLAADADRCCCLPEGADSTLLLHYIAVLASISVDETVYHVHYYSMKMPPPRPPGGLVDESCAAGKRRDPDLHRLSDTLPVADDDDLVVDSRCNCFYVVLAFDVTATVLELIDLDCDCDCDCDLVDIRPQHRHHNIRPAAGTLVDLKMMKMNRVQKFSRSCGGTLPGLGHRPKTP